MKRSYLSAFTSIIVALFLFVGCGGESGQQQTSDTKKMQEDVRTITLIGVDQMKFGVKEKTDGITVTDDIEQHDDLLRLETIEAKPGEKIKIKLITRSEMPAQAMAHNWVLLALDANTKDFAMAAIQAKQNEYIPPKMSEQVLAKTGLAAGGETTEVTFTVPEKTGEYDYICTFPGHFTAGMKGKLIVK